MFLSETVQADGCREREDCQPRILYLEKYIFENKGKKHLDKQNLRKYDTSRYTLEEMLKHILHTEGKWDQW